MNHVYIQDNAKSTSELQLRRDLPKWTSETAITQGALKSKRDEFWETAPKYEGKKVNQIRVLFPILINRIFH